MTLTECSAGGRHKQISLFRASSDISSISVVCVRQGKTSEYTHFFYRFLSPIMNSTRYAYCRTLGSIIRFSSESGFLKVCPYFYFSSCLHSKRPERELRIQAFCALFTLFVPTGTGVPLASNLHAVHTVLRST